MMRACGGMQILLAATEIAKNKAMAAPIAAVKQAEARHSERGLSRAMVKGESQEGIGKKVSQGRA